VQLALRTQQAFDSRIRSRGSSYAASGRVRIGPAEGDALVASVAGSEDAPYRVELVRDAGGSPRIAVSCTCPYFEGGDLCKHIWAVLMRVPSTGWAAPLLRNARRRIDVVPLVGDEDDDGDDLDDAYEDEGDDWLPQEREPAWRPPSASWRERLARLGRQGQRAASAANAPSLEVLCYGIDGATSRRVGELLVRVYARRRMRDQSLGAPTPRRLSRDDPARAATPGEARALELLVDLAQHAPAHYYGGGASLVRVPAALHDPLLPLLAETGRLGLAEPPRGAGGVEIAWLTLDPGAPFVLRLALEPARSGFALTSRFERAGETLPADAIRLALGSGFLVREGLLSRFEHPHQLGWLIESSAGLAVKAREADAFVADLLATPGCPPVELPPALTFRESSEPPAPRLRFERLPEGGAGALRAQLDFRYGAASVAAFDTAPRVSEREARVVHVRDLAAEQDALARLSALGFARTPPRGWARPEAFDLQLSPRAFETAVSELLDKGWQVEAEGARVKSASRSSASVTSGVDFFEIDGGVEFGGETVPFPTLLAAAREGERFVRLGDGSRGLLPREWLARAGGLAGLADVEGGRLRFARSQAALLDVWLEAQQAVEVDARFADLRAKLHSFAGIEPRSEPAGFAGVLREYQREGLGWLEFLREFGLGGCLADDMGLGKTVQVLALLAARKGAGSGVPSLVVAPRSVVHNWLDEARRFAPGLAVLDYTGVERAALRERLAEHDLVLTTYGTLRRDVEALAALRFDYAILDEAQAIKNSASRTAKCARALRAEHRLALTGTPVENHLGELGSLFEFLNPGMLGRASALRALVRPGTAREDGALDALARALRPFLLRRVKTDVLAELPEKTEQAIVCELGKEQRRLYDELRDHYRASLGRRIAKQGLARSKIHVLEALLRLRQAACHPALVAPRFAAAPSAKLETLLAQLEELAAASHKALVFSQFTELLAHVRSGLDSRGIAYEYLDGKTRDRKARVERFQSDPACPVFLISLKAGGVGLNLTAAEYVFLLDPWWNPAVEAQAIDRAHRIGQTRPVFAYRLIARGTVEEKILELQARKRELVEAVFAEDAGGLASLTAEDLEGLLG
jgi:superfamily II DNA or RNA helicase